MRGLNMKLAILPILLTLLASIAMVRPTFANGTTVYLDPATNGPGDFTVNVMVADVKDLYGYQFTVYFDSNILAASGATIGDFFPTPPGYVVWKNEIGGDYVLIAVTRPLGSVSGKSGSGILASIDFVVIGGGFSYLQLENVKLTNPRAVEIEHTSSWGNFNSGVTPVFDAYLTRRRNYNRPEHNLFKLATDGEYQTLMAGCGNGGDASVRVLVTWTITDLASGDITMVSTSKALAVGEETVVSYVVPAVLGSYAVQISIAYDNVGDGTFGAVGTFKSGEGGGGGTYEYTVVP